MNGTKPNQLRTAATAREASRLVSPTMYLVRLRAHLSRGRIALGEVIEAVGDVVPLPKPRKKKNPASR